MYSPKISEDLIPVLYRTARPRRLPMTQLVDKLIRKALAGENLLASLPPLLRPPLERFINNRNREK